MIELGARARRAAPTRPAAVHAVMLLVVATLLAQTTTAQAEEARREPLVGLHLQPNLSILLPSGSARAVTDVYGLAHPTGAIGLSVHPVSRFHLVADLEGHGWTGELPAVALSDEGEARVEAVKLRFLTYWLHLRGRITLVEAGRFQLLADLAVGVLFGRESGDRFRAEGRGVSLGAGPVAWLGLGRYFAMSLSVLVESGWVWYDIASPQSGDSSYSLTWPRVVIGIGLHALLVHRAGRVSRTSEDLVDEEPLEPTTDDAAAQASDVEPAPEPEPPQPDSGLTSPW